MPEGPLDKGERYDDARYVENPLDLSRSEDGEDYGDGMVVNADASLAHPGTSLALLHGHEKPPEIGAEEDDSREIRRMVKKLFRQADSNTSVFIDRTPIGYEYLIERVTFDIPSLAAGAAITDFVKLYLDRLPNLQAGLSSENCILAMSYEPLRDDIPNTHRFHPLINTAFPIWVPENTEIFAHCVFVAIGVGMNMQIRMRRKSE